jgi:hypothetical protein
VVAQLRKQIQPQVPDGGMNRPLTAVNRFGDSSTERIEQNQSVVQCSNSSPGIGRGECFAWACPAGSCPYNRRRATPSQRGASSLQGE